LIPTARDLTRLHIEEFGMVPAIRPRLHQFAADDIRFAVETLNAAGIPIAEINMTVPGAINAMYDLAKSFPKMTIGADLLDLDTARKCMDAGAKFLTSPGLLLDLVEFAAKQNVVAFPGALTPSEVITAWKVGADFVKVFPCSQVGGASYIKALHGPLPHIRLIASGGVNQQTASDFIRNGASALGIGAELIPQEALRTANDSQIRELARRFLSMVKDGRVDRMARS
jgi:2-dehydro-3-deoxyphosphogluconate aldolase/(4S)-4-hydroxy-2-oxoglutarate aldolase